MIEQLFFELIQVALGVRVCLSHSPTDKEWKMLYDMAKKQSLVGICFAGVQKLGEGGVETSETLETSWNLPELLYLTWMGMAAKIQQRNEVVNRQCVELQKKLSADGFRSSILKGQAVGHYYGQLAVLRQSGDIDIYVDRGREKAIEYARGLQGEVDWDYKHLHLHVFSDTEVEMHYVPEVFLNLRKNRKLQKWFKEHHDQMFSQHGDFVTPSIEFNLFYILLHTYRHFLYEGVGLRQMMDYYFVLREAQTKGVESKEGIENVKNVIKSFGMMRFTKGMMWIILNIFEDGTSINHKPSTINLQIEPDEKEGRYILEQVMMGGNFGHHDERLATKTKTKTKTTAVKKILKHNLHLLAHYPSDVIWAPIWIVYHKIWKLMNR